MDLGTARGFRHYVRMATFSLEIVLHQAEVNIR